MKLVFATHNENKVKEIKAILPESFELLSLTDIGCHEDIPETADTIEGNAVMKATYVTEHYGYNCFADDTGLEVEALNGAPGVYSARYAGEQKNSEDNMTKLLQELEGIQDRTARFKTTIALSLNGEISVFNGIVNGMITEARRGTLGFGYDPVFQPDGHEHTFAELPLDVKNSISHRARATRELLQYLNDNAV